MRNFRDEEGAEWEVVVGRESWGTIVAIFVPREGENDPRQTLLDVTSFDRGSRLLREMKEDDLRDLLQISVPKTTDQPFNTEFRGEG
ncbi:MAG: hypothetical protein PVJ76_19555 [Gemmatimonadota bacterium]